MDLLHERIQALEDIYQNYSISRALLVYHDVDTFQSALEELRARHFPIMEEPSDPNARIYPICVGEDPFYKNIQWEQVNLVISWEEDADEYASFLVNTECPGNILLIHI